MVIKDVWRCGEEGWLRGLEGWRGWRLVAMLQAKRHEERSYPWRMGKLDEFALWFHQVLRSPPLLVVTIEGSSGPYSKP